jgi:hypothetical protein
MSGIRLRGALLVGGAILAAGICWAAKSYMPPRAFPAKTYPARDEHANEMVTIAADPYDLPDKASIFVLPYRERGYLPIFLIITNDGDTPVPLVRMEIQLVTANRTKISPATADDIYRRFVRVKRGDDPTRNPLPIPRSRKPQAGLGKEATEEVQNAPFRAEAVEPHGTQAGFFFFDVGDISQPLAGAHLYVSGLRDANGHDLMFFDIAMEKYLTYRPATQ